jgi:hypothetical protein
VHKMPSQPMAECGGEPVIQATWESEIGEIDIPGQSGQKRICETPISMEKNLGVVMHTCHSS